MKITSYGHSCFLVEENNKKILFDPYEDDSVPGLRLPRNICVDQVYCSHEHADHNAKHLVHANTKDVFPVQFLPVPHDDQQGELRGFSNITIVDIHGIKVVHMGDIGRMLTKEEIQKLKGVNVLFLPVGGYYTIDAKIAHAIYKALQPTLTILMHYRINTIGYDVLEDLQDIIANDFPECIPQNTDTYTYTNTKAIITLMAKGEVHA